MTDWTTLWTSALQAAKATLPSATEPRSRADTTLANPSTTSAAGTSDTTTTPFPAAVIYHSLEPILNAREPAFRALLLAWADRLLEEETIEAQLQDERYVLEAEFLAIDGMSVEAGAAGSAAVLAVIERGLVDGIAMS